MNSLKKVVLVNSWVKQRVNPFEVDGGCVIQGGNGAGKTSTLILPLLFFGAKPSEVMKASKKSNSFASRYLPSDSSYVVFEYQKDNAIYMVIVYSQESDSLIYQFCEGSFNEDLFIDAKGKYVTHSEIKHHLQSLHNRNVSRQFKWSQYQEIIQSNKRVPGRDKDSRSINEAKAKYSLCEPNQSISGAEKVAVSIISSSPSFQSIKELIAQEIESFGLSVQEQLETNHNDSNLQSQANVLRQAKKFLQKRDMVLELRSQSDLIKDWEYDLGVQKYIAEQALEHHEDNGKHLTNEVSKLDSQRQELENKYEEKSKELNNQIGTLQGEIKVLNKTIKQIEDRYKSYQDSNIEKKRKDALRLEEYESELKHLGSELETLEGKYEQIITLYDKRQSDIEKAHSKLLDKESLLLSENIKTKNATVTALYKEQGDKLQTLSQSHSKEKQSCNGKLLSATLLEQSLQSSKKNPTNPELERLASEKQTLLLTKEELNKENQSLLSKKGDLSQAISLAENTALIKNGLLEKKKSDRKVVRDNIEDHQGSLKNVNQMLFFKIAEYSQEKADLASRAFNSALLKKPVTDDLTILNSDNLLLGIELDLDGIEPQPILDKDELEKSLAKLVVSEDELTQEIVQLDDELNTLYLEKKDLESDLSSNNVASKKLLAQWDVLEQNIKQNSNETTVELKKFDNDVSERILVAQEKISSINTDLTTIDEKQESEKNSLILEYTKRIDDANTAIQQLEEDYLSFKSGEELRLSDEIAQIESLKQTDLSVAGAKTEAIDKCKSSIEKATNNLKSAKESKEEYRSYQAWLNTEYDNLPSHKAEHLTQSNALSKLTGEKKEQDNEYKKAHDALIAELKGKRRLLQDAEKEVLKLRPLISSWLQGYTAKQSESTVIPPADKIEQKVRKISNDIRDTENSGQKLFRSVMASLRSYEELFKLCQDLLHKEGFQDFDPDKNWKILTLSLEQLMSGTITEHIGTVRQDFLAKSQSLSGLDAKLDETSKKIEDAGRRVSRQFNESGTQFSNIEALESKITSNIDTVGFRKSLKAATMAFEDIKYQSAHEEIPDEYYELVSNAIKDIAKFGRGLDISQFINLEVRVKNSNVGQYRTAHNDKELEGISSEGLSFLILLSLYIAIKNVIQKNQNTKLLWSIDELGKLHHDNIGLLMDILKRENIDFLCANPSTHPKVLSSFKHIYEIEEGGIIKKMDSSKQQSSKDMFLQALKETGNE